MSAPVSICALMLLVTGGGSKAVAFSGMGISVAENRVKGDRAWEKVLEARKSGAEATCRGNLTLGSAPGVRREEKEGSWGAPFLS